MIEYRAAETRDLNQILAIEQDCMAELRERIGLDFPIYDDLNNSESMLLSALESGAGLAFVAEDDDNDRFSAVVGAIIAVDEGEAAEGGEGKEGLRIVNLVVKPEYRRRGIAHSLVERTIEAAKEGGYLEILADLDLPNPEVQAVLGAFGMAPYLERRKTILDPDRYAAKREREFEEWVSQQREALANRRKAGSRHSMGV